MRTNFPLFANVGQASRPVASSHESLLLRAEGLVQPTDFLGGCEMPSHDASPVARALEQALRSVALPGSGITAKAPSLREAVLALKARL
jgi:hypothetical protein